MLVFLLPQLDHIKIRWVTEEKGILAVVSLDKFLIVQILDDDVHQPFIDAVDQTLDSLEVYPDPPASV